MIAFSTIVTGQGSYQAPNNFEGRWEGKMNMRDAFAYSSGTAYNVDYTINIVYSSSDSFFCFTAFKKGKYSSREILGIGTLVADTLMLKEFSESPFNKKGEKIADYSSSDPTYDNVAVKLVLETSPNKKLIGEAKTWVALKGTVDVSYVGGFSDKASIINKVHDALDKIIINDYTYVTNHPNKNKDLITENSTVRIDARISNFGDYNLKRADAAADIKLLNDRNQSFSLRDLQDDGELRSGNRLTTSKIYEVKQNLPADSLFFRVSLSIGKISVKSRDFGIPVFNYFRTGNIQYPDWSLPRFKAVASFLGTSGTYSDNIQEQFEASIADTSNTLAKRNAILTQYWRAIFIYRGIGGYETNEEEGKNLASFFMMPLYTLNDARDGNLESMYLAYCASIMNLTGPVDNVKALSLLDTAAKYKFPPAVYEKGLQLLNSKRYDEALAAFLNARQLGVKRAGFQIALLYEKAIAGKSIKDAIQIYDSLAAQHDVNSLLRLSELNIEGKGVQKNIPKGLEYLNKAIGFHSSKAMLYLSNLYGMKTVPEPSIGEALRLLQKAAGLKNKDAMFQLALQNLSATNSVANSDLATEAVSMLNNAAKANQPEAMHFLGLLYNSGKAGLPEDPFLARYWLDQAKVYGIGNGIHDSISTTNPFQTFFEGAVNYKPSVYYKVVTEYGHVLQEGYADNDPLTRSFAGALSVLQQSLSQKQEIINYIRLIYADRHHKVYGGILTSRLQLPEKVTIGQIVNLSASGNISVGDMATALNGTIGTEGLKDDRLFRLMSINSNMPHGCVMAGTTGNEWTYVGKEFNGYLILGRNVDFNVAVNDASFINNQGYFDIRIDVYNMMHGSIEY